MFGSARFFGLASFVITCFGPNPIWGESFRLATYNLENYVNEGSSIRKKSETSKEKVCEIVLAIRPDVLAVQEIGGASALMQLQEALRSGGLELPHTELVEGFDKAIQVAVLSRFPMVRRHSHTNENFLLRGRRFHSSRGFAEVTIRANSGYEFTLFTAHLKSKRASADADEAELRFEESKLLRSKITACLERNPLGNVVVAGDLNDTKDSPAVRIIIGKGKHRLTDTHPYERNGDKVDSNSSEEGRNISWTHFYSKQDTYSRIDYVLINQAMVPEWVRGETYVAALPNWGIASDHRPVVVTFQANKL